MSLSLVADMSIGYSMSHTGTPGSEVRILAAGLLCRVIKWIFLMEKFCGSDTNVKNHFFEKILLSFKYDSIQSLKVFS